MLAQHTHLVFSCLSQRANDRDRRTYNERKP